METISQKRCHKCGEWKATSLFNKVKTRHDGLSAVCKECQYKLVKAWKAANPEKHREQKRKYRHAHKDKVRGWKKKYRDKCKKDIPANEKHVNTDKKESIPSDVRWAVWERDNFTCQRCGSRRNLTVDHIYPESKGGQLTMKNAQTLCRKCNASKGVKIVDYRQNSANEF